MFGLVAHSINCCVACVGSLLTAAALVGQTIVSLVATLLSGASAVLVFLVNVYEDNRSSFCIELPSMIIHAPVAVLIKFQNAAFALETVLSEVFTHGEAFARLAFSFFNVISCSFISVAMGLKKTVVLVGDSLWFIITFIPVHVPPILGYIFFYLWSGFVAGVVAAYSSLLRLTNFLTDVPLQSLVGIVSSVIIVRLCVDFREEIVSTLTVFYWALVRRLLIHYYSVFNYLTNAETRIITQIVQEDNLEPQELNMEGVDDEGGGGVDALCVVCQERQKCVLILPCRHICLCRECCTRLYRYQRTCPICRAFICHSVTVYI